MSLPFALALAMSTPPTTTTVPDVPDDATAHAVAVGEDDATRAARLFRDGDFVGAAAAFELAHAQTGDPALLFGRAQALRRAGNCGAAIDVFEAFIATAPPDSDRDAAQSVIDACREILGTPTDAPPPDPVPPLPQPPSPPPPPPWQRDVTGGVLLGSGLAIAIAGSAVLGTSFVRARDRSSTEQDHDDRRAQVRTLGSTGVALLITGGAVAIGGVIRYAIVSRRTRTRTMARHGPLVWHF